ncbi:MAG TPA: hypothetical protein VFO54_01525 [Chryseosolibacter sp.]|nr:hypothetical protein [Chryseosolibacter sp.]
MAAEKHTITHPVEERKQPVEDFWLRLDNAAKIYPAIQTEEMTAVFRLSAVLKERIKIQPFLHAVAMLEPRFPYYKMKPRKGFFWYYLQHYDDKITVIPDAGMPCRGFQKDELFFRILVKGNKVSVEFSHILTDGSGGFEFLKSLLLTYFQVCGLRVADKTSFLRPDETVSPQEFEDAFGRHFQMNLPAPIKIPKSFHLPFALRTAPRFSVLSFGLSIPEIMAKAKQFKVSLTVYLVGVYLYALQNIYNQLGPIKQRHSRKIFRVQVPVNLRKLYPSKTMRNFSLFVMPEIDLRLGQYTFEEILKTVYHKLQLETDEKLISKIISRNVGAERNIVLKNTPLFIKSLILYFTYKIQGTSRYSGVITNLGKVSLQEEADELIDYFTFIPPPPNKTLKVNCGVIGFNDKLVLTFGNIATSRELEREFITFLTRSGLRVKLLS